MTNSDRISDMYIKKDTLSIHISLHDTYSVNKYGFLNWIFDQYEIKDGFNILEAGSGTGKIWDERKLSNNVKITLTDFSQLMIEKCSELLRKNSMFSFQQMDLQAIPFADESFDIVIANHMLYHVPDMEKGLREAYRVLKKGGTFMLQQ